VRQLLEQMMRTQFSIVAVAIAATWAGSALAQGVTLPLKKVRLYETGVAYFERQGMLANGSGARLPVPSGHLDDALKTLVVLSPDGSANVSGVEFGSSVSGAMARVLAGLPEEGEAALGLQEMLVSLKGASVEAKTTRGAIAGRVAEVISAEKSDLSECVVRKAAKNGNGAHAAEAGDDCVLVKLPALLLLGKTGEIHRILLRDLTSIKPTDPAVAARLATAVDALSHRGAQARRELSVRSSGSKQVALAYIAETPVWRSTYRLVLTPGDKGALQGWALLHNDTDEDWKQVKVELVNGQPDSFLFPLAAPRYARRDLRTPEDELSTVPQLAGRTVDELWGEGAFGEGLVGIGEGGGGSGQGIGLGSIGTVGHGRGTGTASVGAASSSLLNLGNLAQLAESEGVEAGALFQYALKSAIDLRAHGSALVPFANETVAARRIAWFTAPGETARSAVHLKNEGKQTLPPGPISIFADGGFAGETAVDRLKPKEARVLSFGLDLDVEIEKGRARALDRTKLLGFNKDVLLEHFVRTQDIDYEVENRSASARTVYLSLPFVDNARVEGADEIGYDTSTFKAFAVFRIPARSKKTWHLKAEEGLMRSTAVSKLTSRRLTELARTPGLPKSQRDLALSATDKLVEAEVRHGGRKRRGRELAELKLDIERMRANVRAAAGAPAGAPLVRQLIEAENRARFLRRRLHELSTEADERVRQARVILAKLPARR
jgi:hypothetical protein